MSMLSFDEVGLLLDDMAEEFPPEFFDELNGGVALRGGRPLGVECSGGSLW